ncbi:hypothetical protein GCM10007981_19070 [Thermocladium modestius]|uniref:Uncharacterized protein n=1 Tax=Thermocladium modestius TaxID=62609 RepID=A0A830GYV9_9CREN|nr:hypothetical protein GCM10007981_19070 [Thermocladium modestius]
MSYPALKGGASCFLAPPCLWLSATGRGRSLAGNVNCDYFARFLHLREFDALNHKGYVDPLGER